jgi:hypothetical protein
LAERKEEDLIIEQGQCVSSIAFEKGLTIDRIWNDPANAALKDSRLTPYILAPGDALHVPALEEKKLPVATGATHVFRRVGVPETFQLALHDEAGQPLAGLPYIVDVNDTKKEGVTGSNGEIEVQKISPSQTTAWILIDGKLELELLLGELDPITEDSGVAARLQNLGYLPEAEEDVLAIYLDDVADEPADWREVQVEPARALRAAVRAFQIAMELESTTGELDDATRAKIQELHGC